jgi:hypothetical protein
MLAVVNSPKYPQFDRLELDAEREYALAEQNF